MTEEIPMLRYKTDLFLTTPIAVTLPAVDWLLLMTWASMNHVDTDGINHILHDIMPQIRNVVYTKESISGTEAYMHQQQNRNPFEHINRQLGAQPCATCGRIPNPISAPCADCEDYQS